MESRSRLPGRTAGISPERAVAGPAPDEATLGRIRAAQLQAVFRFTPLNMGVNLTNCALVVHALKDVVNPWALGVWAGVLGTIVALASRSWWKSRGKPFRTRASARSFRRAAFHAGLLAAAWALPILVWFPVVGAPQQFILSTVATAMICAGGFVLATVPPAATAYVTVLAAGSFLGVLRSDLSERLVLCALIATYSGVLIRSAVGTARIFAERFLAEADLEERRHVIALLLAEFEENGSDWLFELDASLLIVEHSPRFSQVSGLDGAALGGQPLPDLLDPVSRLALLSAVGDGKPFHDLEVGTGPGLEPRWWHLSATPIRDEDGRLSGWRGVGSDVTEVKRAQDEITWMAQTDILTGLINRSAFRDRAAGALLAARSGGPPVAIGCLDLDHFKSVNDTLGHAAGDVLLRMVALDLLAFGDQGVTIGRLGGDEFGLLLQGHHGEAQVQEVAGRIIRRLSRSYDIQGSRARIGASVGFALGPEDGHTVDELLRNADLALYRAKEQVRGRAVRYSGAMLQEAEEKRAIKADLVRALERHEFVLFFQPIIDTRSGRTVAFEALVRWRHPQRGLLAPDAFIAIAESSGTIGPLGDWILTEACRHAARWPSHIRVAVNLSPAQLGRSSLMHTVLDAITRSALTANRLELEITEALLLAPEVSTLQFLSEMRALGVGIALDDFGTGFSSLNYLTRYPVSKIKIDRAFVSGGASEAHRGAVIEAVTGLAAKLGLETTAEGVETTDMLTWVAGLGCTHAQGYLFARPMPADEVDRYLAQELRPEPRASRLVAV